MKYNISKMALIESDLLTFDQIYNLINEDDYVTISGTDICDITFILGNRINLNHIRYYFTSITASGTVASGISFYYKNAEEDSYIELSTNLASDYYYANLGTPKYIKIVHTISGTGIVGDITAVELYTEDDEVDFGTDGTTTSKNYNYIYESGYEIEAIPIYNDTSNYANAYVFINPEDKDDSLIETVYLSDSVDGPWKRMDETDDIIVGAANLDKGFYFDTENDNGVLKLSGQTTLSGSYESMIYGNEENNKFKFLYMNYTLISGTKIAVDEDDSYLSIEMRSSNIEPIPNFIYRRIIYAGTAQEYAYYNDYFLHNDVLYRTGVTIITDLGNTAYNGSATYIDPIYTDNFVTFMFFEPPSITYPANRAVLHRYFDGTASNRSLYVETGNNGWSIYAQALFMGLEGDIWLYVFSNADASSDDIDEPGYYLFHFPAEGSFTYDLRIYNSDNFISDLSFDRENGYFYYYDNINSVLVKRNSSGEVVYSIIPGGHITDFKALTWYKNNTLLYLDEDTLRKVDEDGNLIESEDTILSNLDTSTIVTMEYDEEHDLFWMADLNYVYCVYPDYRLKFRVGINSVYRIRPSYNGVWAYSTESWGNHFIDIDLEGVKYSKNFKSQLGVYSEDYSSLNQTFENIPLSDDPVWSTLPWQKVAPEGYMLPNKKYHQARITLRTTYSGVTTPEVSKLYTVPTVKVENIPPGSYKNVYLRTNTNALNLGENYSTYLTVGWEVPV
jgi:hypothetical protein